MDEFEEFDLKAMCEHHRMNAQNKGDTLVSLVQADIIRCPKNVQDMPIRDFFEKYEGSLERFLAKNRDDLRKKNAATSSQISTATPATRPRSKNLQQNNNIQSIVKRISLKNKKSETSMQTPSGNSTKSYLLNGMASVQSKKTPGGMHTTLTPIISVAMGESRQMLDLNSPSITNNLDADQRDSAVAQVERLMMKARDILERLKNE